MSKKLTANFYPAAEEKNGYIGKANITYGGDALRFNGISVFRSPEDKTINIMMPEFGDGISYIVPKTKEAYAAMRDVVEKAVENEKHFAYTQGELGAHMDVSGKMVQEPYADGRFSIDVDDFCVLYGVTTREVEYQKDGKDRSFTAVDLPIIGTYEKDGETQYRTAFEGRISSWEDKEGKKQSINYGQILQGKVLAERKALIKERKPALEDQVQGATARSEAGAMENKGPAQEASR